MTAMVVAVGRHRLLREVASAHPVTLIDRAEAGAYTGAPMTSAAYDNPAIPTFLRRVTLIQALVVGWAALLMFTMPAVGEQLWPWPTPEFSSRFIGAAYGGALLPLVVFVVTARWAPGRMVLWMNLVFTAVVAGVMLAYPGEFHFERFHTWIYWTLYLLIPINSAVFLILLRHLRAGLVQPTPLPWRVAYLVIGAAFGLYGLALLAVPESAASFWPWPVDDFHGRIYSAAYLSAAAGALVLSRSTAAVKEATFGGTALVFGGLSVVGLLVTHAGLPAGEGLSFQDAGVLVFIAYNLAMVALGAVLGARWLGQRRGAPVPTG